MRGVLSLPPVHRVSAWASSQRLVLARETVAEKTNECAAVRAILERLSITSALVSIDALKRNQPSLHDEFAAYFNDPETRRASGGVC